MFPISRTSVPATNIASNRLPLVGAVLPNLLACLPVSSPMSGTSALPFAKTASVTNLPALGVGWGVGSILFPSLHASAGACAF